ncbi:unnamed protein product [Cuscuta epithymum]|uniref:Uncharacterized protein n=1 Tax=Cuscuta epithymum TaxID=186058 RepID=A0AAV0ELZ5_9ASTE|nr:unnamed protein product [Cuscuta epithymum]
MATKTTMITSPSPKVHTSTFGARRFQIPFRSASLSSNKISSSVIRFRNPTELNRASAKSLSNPPTILSEDVGEMIGEISILRLTGEEVKFKQLWDQEEGSSRCSTSEAFWLRLQLGTCSSTQRLPKQI